MINKKFFKDLKKEYDAHDKERRIIISLSNNILHDSKRTIFGLHRGDIAEAAKQIEAIEGSIKGLQKKFGAKRVVEEGAYKAGVEEYIEAKTFYNVLNDIKIDKIKGISLFYDSYLAGICDLTGELVRLAVNEAAAGRIKEVGRIKVIISDILAELVQFDMTSYLRTKYDQAKRNLSKVEQIDYEISIRG